MSRKLKTRNLFTKHTNKHRKPIHLKPLLQECENN